MSNYDYRPILTLLASHLHTLAGALLATVAGCAWLLTLPNHLRDHAPNPQPLDRHHQFRWPPARAHGAELPTVKPRAGIFTGCGKPTIGRRCLPGSLAALGFRPGGSTGYKYVRTGSGRQT